MALQAHMELDSAQDMFLQENLGPTIAEHASECSLLFKNYMIASEIVQDPTLLDDQLARFTLWASNMDVFGPPNVSLDYRLRYSPTIVDIIHQLLDVICHCLTSLNPYDDPPQTPAAKKRRISDAGNVQVTKQFADDSSDSDSDGDQAQKTASLITHTIGGTVTRLFRLSNAIRKSATASRTRKIAEYTENEEANTAIKELCLYTECYIRFRFPKAQESLRSALIEANALRLRRLYYQMSHRRRIALTVQRPQKPPKGVQLLPAPITAPTVVPASSMLPMLKTMDGPSKPTSLPPAPVTYATTARQTAVGAMYADSSVEIPRAKSVLVNSKLSFPPAPASNDCPYCGVIVEFQGTRKTAMWNDHVMKDLEPFICIFAHCTDPNKQESALLTFETSRAWMNHMHSAHGYSWECRAPSHDPIIFEQEVEHQQHSQKEHGVPEVHVASLSSAARRPTLGRVRECPFGDESPASENAESNTIFANEALHLHIAAHMKEIALLTLQKLPSDDKEQSEVASDAPLDDDGVARLRGSMYSVLDDESLEFSDEIEDSALNTVETDLSALADGLDLEDKDKDGMTNLHHAARDGNLSWALSLVRRGANRRSRANNGKTALHYASQNGHVQMMELLLDSDASEDKDLKDDSSQTPLHYAAVNGHEAVVQLLLATGQVEVDSKDSSGQTPLSRAAGNGHEAVVQLLLATGQVEVDSKDSSYGRTPLSRAARNGHEAVVQLLLATGQVEVNSKDSEYGRTPLSWAAGKGHEAVVQLLLATDQVEVDSKDSEYGQTPLSWAAENGHKAVVQLLLATGQVEVDSKSMSGQTPLSLAAEKGHEAVVQLLLATGQVEVDSKDSEYGRTPLSWAAGNGHEAVVQLLLATGQVEADSKDSKYGRTPLSRAAENGHEAVVQLLLATGQVEVDSKDSFGQTPLSRAAENGHEAVVQLLQPYGSL